MIRDDEAAELREIAAEIWPDDWEPFVATEPEPRGVVWRSADWQGRLVVWYHDTNAVSGEFLAR